MARFLFALALLICVGCIPALLLSQDHKTTAPEDYLFVWAGDADHKGNDFLAVIDADPVVGFVWAFGDDAGYRSKDYASAPHGIHHARQRNALCQRS